MVNHLCQRGSFNTRPLTNDGHTLSKASSMVRKFDSGSLGSDLGRESALTPTINQINQTRELPKRNLNLMAPPPVSLRNRLIQMRG